MTSGVVNSEDRVEQRVKNMFRGILQQKVKSGWMEVAQAYAQEGLCLEGGELKRQVERVMYSLQTWRGRDAKRVKKVLRRYGGQD